MKYIGVLGCLPEMPIDFPIIKSENSGNMIHAQAPLKIIQNSIYINDEKNLKILGYTNFTDFVNNECSHLIITMANSLSVEKKNPEKYRNFRKSLEKYKVPIVIFGLGVQLKQLSKNDILEEEAINLIKFLSERSNFLGVRGEITKEIIFNSSKINNLYVTGCPSIYSYPSNFEKLKKNILEMRGRPSFSITNLENPIERDILLKGFLNKNFIIEPVSKLTHEFYHKISIGENTNLPYYWYKILNEKKLEISKKEITDYYQKYYRLFRDVKSWINFNDEFVSYTYGTRFHVNVSSILSGKPALWITHDVRTKELVDFHKLPSIKLEDSVNIDTNEMIKYLDYEPFFSNLERSFQNFENYLIKNNIYRNA